jgi:hypothetical protein
MIDGAPKNEKRIKGVGEEGSVVTFLCASVCHQFVGRQVLEFFGQQRSQAEVQRSEVHALISASTSRCQCKCQVYSLP